MPTKKMWMRLSGVVSLLVSVALAGSAAAQAGTVVRVDPASAVIASGQTVTVSIKVDNVANLIGAEVHLSFSAAVLEVVDADAAASGVQITNGGMLSPDFVAQNNADNTNGLIDFAISQLNRPAFNGSGTLATISFRAKANGTSSVAFRSVPAAPTGIVLANASGTPIAHTMQNGTITVGPTPTPGTPAPGASPTPTRTPTPGPSPTPGPPGRHQVKPGETLYCIGRAYGVTPWSIAMTNHVFWPYKLTAGNWITIPNSPWTKIPAGPICQRQFQGTPPAVPTVPTPTPGPGCRASYVVVPGDWLLAIARKYNVNVFDLGARNGIFNLNLIHPGQLLCIP